MNTPSTDVQRRLLLQSAAALSAGLALGESRIAHADATPGAGAAPPPGRPGDFDFLTGEWRIRHRRLKDEKTDAWDEFDGEATCWGILGGVGSVEELRIPARDFSGMGLRLLDVERKVWNDFWVNGKSGALATPGMTGHFIDGAGIFAADEVDAGSPIKVRGVWDRITPRACRWHQSVSRDGGKTWTGNWFMDWRRHG